MRARTVGTLLVITCIHLSGFSAFADQFRGLESALSVCTELPATADVVSKRLAEGGWAADAKAVWATFNSGAFAYNLNPDDIAYSLDNGSFMAASILGNSAMPPYQPGFSISDTKLSVLMSDTVQAYCVISGNLPLFNELAAKVSFTETLSSAVHRRLEGQLAAHSIIIVVLDRAKLEPIISASKPQYVKPQDFVFDEVNVFVMSAKKEE